MTQIDTFTTNIKPVDISQFVERAAEANIHRPTQIDISTRFEPIDYKSMHQYARTSLI